MKIQLWSIGRDHDVSMKQAIEDFTKRLNNYFKTQWLIIAPPKQAAGAGEVLLKKKEAELILSKLTQDDYLVLLDEKGKLLSSPDVATFLEARAMESTKNIIFLIGGAYGVEDSIFKRANYTWSLSMLVFPHHLVRLILAEQLYRACTIIKNEKYHHK